MSFGSELLQSKTPPPSSRAQLAGKIISILLAINSVVFIAFIVHGIFYLLGAPSLFIDIVVVLAILFYHDMYRDKLVRLKLIITIMSLVVTFSVLIFLIIFNLL